MVNYGLGKIYKIEPITGGEDGDVYVGSTTKELLSQRMANHRADYKRWKNGKHRKVTSYDIFDKYGIDNCQITLLEQVNATCKDELNARERHYIESLACVNKCIVGRTVKEYRRLYYKDNREQIIAKQMAEYYGDNREQIIIKRKEYYQANREKLIAKMKEYHARKKQQQLKVESNT
jgi:iron only hydrogenase large subunit-like protein